MGGQIGNSVANSKVVLAGEPKIITFTDMYSDKYTRHPNTSLCVLFSRNEYFLAFMQKRGDGTFCGVEDGKFAEVGVSAPEALKAMIALSDESEFAITDSGSEYAPELPYRVQRFYRIHARPWPLPHSVDELVVELDKFAVNEEEKSSFFGDIVDYALRRLGPTESSQRFE